MKYFILAFILAGISYQIQAQVLESSDFLTTHSNSSSLLHDNSQPPLKNKNVALAISVTSSIALPVLTSTTLYSLENNPKSTTAIILLSLLPGPTLGYLYTPYNSIPFDGLFRRSIGIGLAVVGSFIVSIEIGDGYSSMMGSMFTTVAGGAVFLTGVGIYCFSTISDFIGVRKNVDDYNESLLNRVQITPSVDPVLQTFSLGLTVNL